MSTHKLPGEFLHDGCPYDNVKTSLKMLESVGDLNLTPEDTIVVAYSKAGTLWMKFVAYLVLHEGKPPKDDTPPVYERRHMEFRFQGEKEDDVLRTIQQRPSPRLLSTHARFQIIEKLVTEKNVKVILVMRNPKDALVSLFHFYQMNGSLGNFEGTWNEFFELFKQKRLWGGDFFDFNKTWWLNRKRENILIVTYEEMSIDPRGVVRRVGAFLDKDLSDNQITYIVHKTSFDQMKLNSMVNGNDVPRYDLKKSAYLRKGQIGDWKNYFSIEQQEYVDQLQQETCAPVGLSFRDYP